MKKSQDPHRQKVVTAYDLRKRAELIGISVPELERRDRTARRMGAVLKKVVLPAAAVGLTIAAVAGSEKGAADHEEKIQACASVLVGHEVEFAVNPKDGLPMVRSEVYNEVNACQKADGDIEKARIGLDDIHQSAP